LSIFYLNEFLKPVILTGLVVLVLIISRKLLCGMPIQQREERADYDMRRIMNARNIFVKAYLIGSAMSEMTNESN